MPRGVKAVPQSSLKPEARLASNGYRLPDPLPPGEVLTDNMKHTWILGESIGIGGFGEIYTAKSGTKNLSEDDYGYVIKVDHNTGPLFSEMHFYHRVGKADSIKEWIKRKGLDFLGMPHFVASGIHDKQSNLSKVKGRGRAKPKESLKYRFLVIPRFGTDLQVMINKYISFSVKTTYTIAIKVIDILEYIHSHGYTHGDIKGSNLLLSRQEELKRIKSKKTPFSKVYVVDFGLVERYVYKDDGVHKKYEEDARRANNGTVEFMSRDGHIGAFSRRGDLEILGFNMLSWLSGGKLPWMSDLKNLDFVRDSKNYYMEKLDELLNYCFSEYTNGNPEASAVVKSSLKKKSRINGKIDKVKLFAGPPGIVDYLSYVAQLDFEEEPDYEHLKNLLVDAITESGAKYDEKFTFDDKDIATNGENGSTITPPSTIVKKSAKRRKSPSPTRPATPTKAASRKRKSPSVSSLSSPQKRSPRKTKSPTRPVVTRKRKS